VGLDQDVTTVRRYLVRPATDADEVMQGIEERTALVREHARSFERTVYETFDWRLFRDDSVLEHRRDGDRPVMLWRSLSTGETLGRVPLEAVPRFAWHLPPTPVSERLGRVTEVRALLPLVTLDTTVEGARVVDADDKTLGRLTLERTRVQDGPALPPVLELTPVRGYEHQLGEVTRLLDAQVGLTPDADDPVVLALRAAGFDPGSYSSKLRLQLSQDATAQEAWLVVLRALFATVQVNEAGLRDDLDSEFLHDYRVAVRRTRSVLKDAKQVLEPATLVWARDEFRWIGQVTSPARDADVFLLSMPDFEAQLPAERRDDLKAFAAFLEAKQQQTHTTLVEALDSPRYRELVVRWREFLDRDEPAADTRHATTPAVKLAGARIAKAHRRIIRRGRAINDSSHPEELHELRKDAKRLRYLLECFGSLFPPDMVQPVVRQLKGLQEVLGDYQDSQVQASSIEQFGQQMIEARDAPAATLIAMGSIVEQLDAKGRRARAEFGERFHAFDHRDVRHRIRQIERQGSSGSEASA
jgi:CHAD domain-containing protein